MTRPIVVFLGTTVAALAIFLVLRKVGPVAKPAVLFLCTGNSARSQMAEALLRREAGDRFEVYSAGTKPAGINPLTVRVMNELGIDMSSHRSRHLDEYLGRVPVDIVITVCNSASQSCPVWPGAVVRLNWDFEDPAAAKGLEEEKLAKFRQIRDQIHERIKQWLKEQAGGTATPD